MKTSVAIEGVETSGQVDFLYDADANQVQASFSEGQCQRQKSAPTFSRISAPR
jgi:EAL domain-containing protein (putative c-di-GMP-specific phosphodiesterase class I)